MVGITHPHLAILDYPAGPSTSRKDFDWLCQEVERRRRRCNGSRGSSSPTCCRMRCSFLLDSTRSSRHSFVCKKSVSRVEQLINSSISPFISDQKNASCKHLSLFHKQRVLEQTADLIPDDNNNDNIKNQTSNDQLAVSYQWVSGSVGDVDNQTLEVLPQNSTSNQNARPWHVPVSNIWNSNGISDGSKGIRVQV